MNWALAWGRVGGGKGLRWLALAWLGLSAGLAFAQSGMADFDHLRTGFALTGTHASTRCESCHLNGVFKGTPRDCVSCHTAGAAYARGNMLKPANHPPTNLGCDSCHNTSTYTGALFTHTGVTAGSCATCHNGGTATGKPMTGHIATSAACDACHISTMKWLPVPAMFNHAGIAAGSCSSCHGGSFANIDVKSPAHVATAQPCDTCHRTTAWAPATFTHTGVAAGSCATCHNGTQATGKPTTGHVATTAACDTCHTSTTVWLPVPATFNHAGIGAGTCISCHGGSFANIDVKTPTHVTTSAQCDTCHLTTAWKPATFSHVGLAAGSCATCHNGTQATGKPTTGHIATTAACDTCHNSTAVWLPVPATYNHAGIGAGTCISCHGGSFANIDVKTPAHVTTSAQCDTCHLKTAWKPATFDHVGVVAGTCASCHNGTSATGKPTTGHITTTAACDTCHNSTAVWLPVPATYNHAGIGAGTCISCHGGSFANIDVKTPTHVTTTAQCDTCHLKTAWKPATFSHVGIAAGSCATCHNGTQATGKPTTGHITTTAACDSCHNSTTVWLPVPATYNHAGIAKGSCSSCHGGSFANIDVKSATHISTTAQCDTCHLTTKWTGAVFDHTGVAAGSCATCHNGTSATGKPTTGHIATTAACDTCHNSTTVWLPVPATYNHAGIGAGTCISCHGGSFANIDVKTPAHIPTTGQCDTCHLKTAWKPATFSHAGLAAGTCATCHNGTSATGKPTTGHIVTTAACDSCHNSTAVWLPVPATYNHAGIAKGSCSSCHGGAFANIDVKSAAHISTTAQCDTCHLTTTWTGAVFDHTGVAAGTCATCHNGTSATGKPTTGHIATTAACDTCHNSTTVWLPVPATYNHAGIGAGTCISCHGGSFANIDVKTPTHVTTSAQCDTCHLKTAWKPATFSHVGIAAGSCATCHNGTQATGKPTTGHIVTTAACDTCHNSTTVWLPVPATYNHAGIGAGTCISCHGGSFANIDVKTPTHVTTTAQCDTCHLKTAWKPATYDHVGVVAGTCASCHNGTQATGKPTTGHITTTAACDTCHNSTSVWLPVPATYNHAGIGAGTCISCHGGSFANIDVKTPTHVTTTAQCDTCHLKTAWKPATFSHAGVVAGTCASCHNGTQATGKPTTGHIVTTAACDACHNSTTIWLPVPATYNHAGIGAGTCISCHGGSFANIDVKTPTHVTTTAQCDTCHLKTAWKPATFSHAGVAPGSCATCHNGTQATGKPTTGHIVTTAACDACHNSTAIWLPVPATYNHAGIGAGTCISCHGGSFANIDVKTPTHITTTAQCDTCHLKTAWKPATFNHVGVVAGTCATCHNGAQATGKPTTGHIVTTAACDSCHTSTVTWLPVPATYSHAGIGAGTCISCHGGSFANIDVKTPTHITTTAQCDTCHRTTAWKPATFTHTAVTPGSCATCHNGTQATGKPTTGHITTTAACDSCHTSTVTWLPVPATYNHAGIAPSTCNSCHGGSFTNIDVKSATHIMTTAQCDVCHRTTAWTPASFNHAGVAAGSCGTCHNGTQATGKPTTGHIPTTAACDSCHKSTTTWLPVPATYNHAGIAAGTCISCHGGSFANIDVKSASHLLTTSQCDACHSKTAWTPATSFNHTGVAPGTCATCHNGTQATGKNNATHIPTTAACDACHNTAAFKPATMNHTVVTATSCKTCHSGTYVNAGTTGALAKPTNHIPEATQLLNGAAMDCNACHTNTTSWTAETMNHNGSMGNGSGWCIGCHRSGTSFLGSMQKKSLTHDKSTGVTDCSQSGCHRPLGTKGSTYRNWD